MKKHIFCWYVCNFVINAIFYLDYFICIFFILKLYWISLFNCVIKYRHIIWNMCYLLENGGGVHVMNRTIYCLVNWYVLVVYLLCDACCLRYGDIVLQHTTREYILWPPWYTFYITPPSLHINTYVCLITNISTWKNNRSSQSRCFYTYVLVTRAM